MAQELPVRNNNRHSCLWRTRYLIVAGTLRVPPAIVCNPRFSGLRQSSFGALSVPATMENCLTVRIHHAL